MTRVSRFTPGLICFGNNKSAARGLCGGEMEEAELIHQLVDVLHSLTLCEATSFPAAGGGGAAWRHAVLYVCWKDWYPQAKYQRRHYQATHGAADLYLCLLCTSFMARLSSCCCYATAGSQFQMLRPFAEVEVLLMWRSTHLPKCSISDHF